MTYLLWYVPIAAVSMLVFQACKHDDAATIVRKALKDFLALTGICVGLGAAMYLLHKLP